MAYLRCTVLADTFGGYTIEVRSVSSVIEVIGGFPNEDRANIWIRERRRAEFAANDRSPKLAPEILTEKRS